MSSSLPILNADFELFFYLALLPTREQPTFDPTSRAMRLASKASKTGRDAISRRKRRKEKKGRERNAFAETMLRRTIPVFRRKIFERGDYFLLLFLAYVSGRRPFRRRWETILLSPLALTQPPLPLTRKPASSSRSSSIPSPLRCVCERKEGRIRESSTERDRVRKLAHSRDA